MNIVFWNSQGLIPKRKELQNYLLENQTDILALNETFFKPKFKFHLPGYDIYKNDRLVGKKGGVAILVKKLRCIQTWFAKVFKIPNFAYLKTKLFLVIQSFEPCISSKLYNQM